MPAPAVRAVLTAKGRGLAEPVRATRFPLCSDYPHDLRRLPPPGERGNSVGFVVVLRLMAGLAQVDWQSLANEAQVRALLEDFVSHYTVSAVNQLALAVWFQRCPQASEHKLLMLFTGPQMNGIESERQSLL